MDLPEASLIVFGKGSIVGVLSVGLVEWQITEHHLEQNHACREQIGRSRIVRLVFDDFRRHIVPCAKVGLMFTKSVGSLDESRKSEVSKLNAVVAVKQEIFHFQVAVHKALLVTVLNASNNFMEIKACKFLIEGARLLDDVEKFALSGDLESDIEDFPRAAARLLVLLVAVLDKLNDVWVVEVLERGKLLVQINKHAVGDALIQLESDFSARLRVDCELDFGLGALAEAPCNLKPADGRAGFPFLLHC